MKRTLISLLAAALALSAGHTDAANIPLITGPQNVAALNDTLNKLINQINGNTVINNGATGTFQGALGVTNSSTVAGLATTSGVLVTGGISGVAPPSIGANDPNATNSGLVIKPQGNGLVHFGTSAQWVQATGLQVCPGMVPGSPPLPQGNFVGRAPSSVVTSYLVVRDYENIIHYIPTC